MASRIRLVLLVVLCALIAGAALSRTAIAAPDPAAVERAFQAFWNAADPQAAARLADGIVATGVTFEEALTRLRRGRPYVADAPRGLQRGAHRTPDGIAHSYAITIPDDYDPARSYQVRFQLHGGIGRPAPAAGREGIDRIVGNRDQIYVHPNAWIAAPWWYGTQVDNLLAILDRLKRTYNIDENRVHLAGISDGGTGVYFHAFRETTPWASFLPLIGSMMVLANTDTGADGDLFPGNAVNKPFFVVNNGRDPLYPATAVWPYVEHLRTLGTDVVFQVHRDSGHNTNWWPEEQARFEAFVQQHPRDPLPDRLSWQTERTDRYNRAHWLVIDRLGRVAREADLADSNFMDFNGPPELLLPPPGEIFPREGPSGRVDLVRRGNSVEVSTRGVTAFTLLLSPDEFDFSQPIKVLANGLVAFEGKIDPGVDTLLKWAARDNDRTMLFAAELKIELGK